MALDDYTPEKYRDKMMPSEPSSIKAFITVLDQEDQQRIDSIKSLFKALTYGGMMQLCSELDKLQNNFDWQEDKITQQLASLFHQWSITIKSIS